MLKFVLIVDCERFISFKQGNPRWNLFERAKGKINNLLKNIRYNKFGYEIVLKSLKEKNFPATLMIVGNLFRPKESFENIEFGYHSRNHLPLTLINDEKLKEQVKNIYKLKSFNAPMWMIEDEKNPFRIFLELKKQKYTHCVYRGRNNGIKHFHYNSVELPLKKEGVICVHVSNFFEGNWNKKRIRVIKEDIIKNLDNKGVYLLTTHDFTHKTSKNLMNMLDFLKKLEKDNKIKILKLKDVKI